VARLCEFYPGICLTTEEKARKKLSQGKKNLSQVKRNLSQSCHSCPSSQNVIFSKSSFRLVFKFHLKTRRRRVLALSVGTVFGSYYEVFRHQQIALIAEYRSASAFFGHLSECPYRKRNAASLHNLSAVNCTI